MKRTILMPLARQFTIVLIIFFICTIGITLYSTYDYTRLQTGLLNTSLESYSAQLAKSTSQSYESYESICYSVAYSQVVQSYLKSRPSQNRYEQYQQLENLLTNTANLNPYIIDIAVYGQDGTFASLSGSSSIYETFTDVLSDSRYPYRSAGVATINRTPCHMLTMPIYSLGTGERLYLGSMFLAIDKNSLFGSSLSPDQKKYNPQVVFMDARKQLIYGEESLYNLLETNASQSEAFELDALPVKYAVTKYTLPGIDHTLYVLMDKSEITTQAFHVSLRQILGMSALILVFLLLLLILYRPLIGSLHQLTLFMKSISAGDRRVYKEGATLQKGFMGSIEIDEITQAFNDMLVESDRLNHTIFETYTRMYELEANRRKTEIAFLRSQINPHFLYNTLTMICGMSAMGMNEKVISVTSALSQIFRYSIKGSDMVTLREEMDIVRSYIMIQEARFEDRFTVKYEFSDGSYDYRIPKMVIQPLVENAIVHGLEKSLRPGKLVIGAGMNPQHGYLAIWIFDTGVGMPQSKLDELRTAILESSALKTGDASSDLAKMDAENHDSIGILNVNSRMVLYYGSDYTLIIDSEENVGTNIQIRVPPRPCSQTSDAPVEPSDNRI